MKVRVKNRFTTTLTGAWGRCPQYRPWDFSYWS